MLVVLAVLGLAGAVAAASIGRGADRLGRDRASAAALTRLADARRQAMLTGEARVVRPSSLAAGATLVRPLFEPAGALVFYPDGSSNGGTVIAGGRELAAVDWLTGQARRGR